MTNVNPENPENPADQTPGLDDVILPEGSGLPHSSGRGHAKLPQGPDDEDLAAAEYQERVAAGLEDYGTDQVPDAADPLPAGTSEEAERARRALVDPNDADEDEYPRG